MDNKARFFDVIKKEMGVTLATSSNGRVTMRVVSPVYYKGCILMFTNPQTLKYKQLAENPNCCIAAGSFFCEAEACMRGSVMLESNSELREVYAAKFPGAFDENVEFGGIGCDFIILKPTRLTGWGFKDDVPTADGIPNEPFETVF